MKKINTISFLLLTLLLTFSFSKIIYAQWVQVTSGMGNMQVLSLTFSGNNIYAGGPGVFKSTDNGASWTHLSLNNNNIRCVIANGNYVFAGTYSNDGIYRSTNNGLSWAQTSFPSISVVSFAVSGNYVFAGSNSHGIYLTTDNGYGWLPAVSSVHSGYSFAVNGNMNFAGSDYGGVFYSTDNGFNWAQTSFNSGNIYSLAASGNNVFAGTYPYTGVYVSTNNGNNWSQTSLNNRSIHSLAIYQNNIFAATGYPVNSGIYLSTNNGLNWIQRNEGLGNNLYVHTLCIINNFIFAGTDGAGVFRRPLSEIIGIKSISEKVPVHNNLFQNYPNPFNPATNIQFSIHNLQFVTLKVFDVLGNEVSTLVNEQLKPGTYEKEWDGSNFSSGVYYYKLVATDYTETKKMVLVK